ncbi:MAG TPA: YihY/virulence factor BrkB family protein [Devosia sp.]
MDKPVAKQSFFSRAKSLVWGTIQAFLDPDTSLRCAGTAFFGFLSIFPAVGIVVFTYGLVADVHTFIATIETLALVVPRALLEVLREQLRILVSQPRETLSIGLVASVLLALWSGSRGVSALIYAMSRVRKEPERRGFFKTLIISVLLTIGGAIFLTIALLTIAGLPALIPFPTGEKLIVLIVRWPVLLALTTGVLMVLYRWGPDRHPRKFSHIWPGAVIASLLWLVAGALFSIYVENFSNYQASFGSVTAAVVLLLWLYNSAQIFVLGAAFNAQLDYQPN